MKYFNLKNGETIAYNDIGTSDNVVLLIHGNMCSSKYLEKFARTLSSDFRVVSPDLRGFGCSSYNNKVNSFEEYASDIIELINGLNIKELTLIGWSTGGAVSMEIAIALESQIKKLILISSVASTGFPMRKLTNISQDKVEFLQTREEVENDAYRTKILQNAFDNKDKEFLRMVFENTMYDRIEPTKEEYDAFIEDAFTQKNISDIYYSLMTFNISNIKNGVVAGNGKIHTINAPTLIIHGKFDQIMPVEMGYSLKHSFGDSGKILVGDFGHSPFVDCFDWLNKNIFEFLR